jgi:hypothetical protein
LDATGAETVPKEQQLGVGVVQVIKSLVESVKLGQHFLQMV